MTSLIGALTEKAQVNLARNRTIDILNAAFEIEADPQQPDDEGAMRQNVRIEDAFIRTLPWLNRELEMLSQICGRYGEDFDGPATTMLRAALLAKRYELEEIREWNTARPLLHLVTPMVGVWAVAWTVTLGNRHQASSPFAAEEGTTGDNRAEICYREYINDGAMDAVTVRKVRDRLRQFTAVMDRVLDRFCRDNTGMD